MKLTEITPKYVNFLPPVSKMKQGVLYISKLYKTTSHLCACGCGNEIVLPFGLHGWTLTESLSGVTMRPSVGSYSLPCRSHYFITDNQIEWL